MKIAILGGTFDPVHYGHLTLAEEVRKKAGMDRVLFVPAAVSPFKTDSPPAPGELRYEMLHAAVRNHPEFVVSRVELDRDPPSYSIDTLEILSSQQPADEFFLVVGQDQWGEFETWKDSGRILERYRVLMTTRAGYQEQEKRWGSHPGVQVLRIAEIPISATQIRACLSRGESVAGLVPPAVLEIIEREQLYR